MTDGKFNDLKSVANLLQTPVEFYGSSSPDGIMTSAGVQQLFQNVVLGDAENATWNGGGANSTALGNLSSTSTQAQVEALVGKWFLGTDLPGLQMDTHGNTASATYQQTGLPLYGSSGAPAMTDVLQGSLADSALLANIAETAFHDPSSAR